MKNHSALAREYLETLDVQGIRRLWPHVFPHLPVPDSDTEIRAMCHIARTESQSVRFKLRAYSHAWLMERGYPSQLPDELRPRASRLYPVIASAVGISINFRGERGKAAALVVGDFMRNAILEAEADGKLLDAEHVTKRMQEAKRRGVDYFYG